MNRIRFALLGLGMLLVVSAAQAQETHVKANIPFDFVVGKQTLPAGEYMLAGAGNSNQAILIRSNDGKTANFATTSSCTSSSPSESTKLIFHTLGGRYFLSQIWTEGYSSGRQLRKSEIEVQLAKNNSVQDKFVLQAKAAR